MIYSDHIQSAASRSDHSQATRAIEKAAADMTTIGAGKISLKDEGSSRWWTLGVHPFRISKFVVTQELYHLVTHGRVVDCDKARAPIVEVSWIDAVRFCNLLSLQSGLKECYSWDASGEISCDWSATGYRLPSEAEWEFACRAGSNAVRYGNLDDIAWYRENSGEQLHDVGQRAPNEWGLYDLIGNVWEWCWNLYDAQVYGEYRVFRGGGYCDLPHACRASCRRKSHPTFRIDDLGFRLAQSLA
jgi:sulfatase modifying factor 1